ncbi:hypothetical protein ACM9HF_02935 [Colwellia sp. RE-S-Sl-9]
MATCKACHEEIRDDATVCKHCGHKEKLDANRVGIYIGVILSVISLATIAFSTAVKLFESKNADIVGQVLSFENDKLDLSLSNRGKSSAVIWDLTITYPEAGRCNQKDYEVTTRMELKKSVIEPNKTIIVPSKTKDESSLHIADMSPEARADEEFKDLLKSMSFCTAKVIYLDFDNEFKNKEIAFTCAPLAECIEHSNKSLKQDK